MIANYRDDILLNSHYRDDANYANYRDDILDIILNSVLIVGEWQ